MLTKISDCIYIYIHRCRVKRAVGAVSKAGKALVDLQKDASKALESLLKRAWANQRELRILVTGKTGQGKSTLINGILGAYVAIEGAGAKRCTTQVEMFSKTLKGVPIKVFDSPGLQDRTANEEEYIQEMRETCQQLSLVIYCTKMINTRLTDDDKNAMLKLTRAFGEGFWNYSVFVLTFANLEDVTRVDDRDADESEPEDDDEEGWRELEKRRFAGRLEKWKIELQSFLVDEVGVSQKIAKNIPVIPTGDNKKTRKNKQFLCLPDRDNWFNNFWEACCLRVKETRLFLQINSDRMVAKDEGDDDLDDDDNEKDDIEEPVVC